MDAVYRTVVMVMFIILVEESQSSSEADILLSFKRQFDNVLPDWSSDTIHQMCNWTGITCNNRGLVTKLDLVSSKLYQSHVNIATLVQDLRALEHLNLSSNLFHGRLPQNLTSCHSLITLDLSDNFFIGTFPASLTRCTKLQQVFIARNNLTGFTSGFTNWSRLFQLDLSENVLHGVLPITFNSLSQLQQLHLRENKLKGSIPGELGEISTLTTIDLRNNVLHGDLPVTLGNCTLLEILSGRIPSELGRLAKLQVLNLHRNNFTGELPASLGNCSELIYLLLKENQLIGSIPSELGKLTKVQTLFFENNHFTGSIPSSLSNCSSLSKMLFYQNDLSGMLPKELGLIQTLVTLGLSGNNLDGKITFDFGTLSELEYASFKDNQFEGDLPRNIANCTHLKKMDFSGNHFTGEIPQRLGNLENLTRIQLYGNNLTGGIPSDIGNLTQLGSLLLHQNALNGRIPAELGSCGSLVELDVSSNALTEDIPRALCSLTRLQHINLSHNFLTNEIPTCIGSCFRLIMLDFSYNMLSGLIPQSISNLSSMALGFILSNNQLHDLVPDGLMKMIFVQRIDLSQNLLFGQIPNTISACVELEQLNLSGNKLNGSISEAFKSLISLEKMDLSRNLLSGEIPLFLASMSQLQYLNLSYNKFAGKVPTAGIFLNSTASSFIGNPKLCGVLVHKSCKKSHHAMLAVIIGGPILCILTVSCMICWFFFVRRKVPIKKGLLQLRSFVTEFSAEDLLMATNGYAEENIIGASANSVVYKATLQTGRVIAVKRYNKTSVDQHFDTFIRELQIIGRIKHRNLIKVLGYSRERSLVLEFMQNGGLDRKLREEPNMLDWPKRLNIALGVAHALDYLHNGCLPPVVHCDLKPSNILLDDDYEPHIADFGISEMIQPVNMTEEEILSLSLRGTLGYIPPEYSFITKPLPKGDVYSFGIILLEMVSGKGPTDESLPLGTTLRNWAASIEVQELMKLYEDVNLQQMKQIIHLGLVCSTHNYMDRPNMNDVVKMLKSVQG